MSIEDQIKNIAIESLQETKVYEKLKEDLDSVQKYQEALYVLAANPDEEKLNILRIGTILSFSVIGKIIQGKDPKSFTPEDWKDIADNVAEYGIIMDGQQYTEFVFNLFAVYIDISVDLNKQSISDEAATEIKGLASDIRELADKLDNGEISEPNYVDDCLWISFEAMIKLLAAYLSHGFGEEFSSFIQAVADLSVQYGRYRLYQQELELINGYLEGQKVLDEELEEKYKNYLDELQAESNEFNRLIENAFSDDFDEMLRNSVSLAKKAGVEEEKILDSKEKIDSFFLD